MISTKSFFGLWKRSTEEWLLHGLIFSRSEKIRRVDLLRVIRAKSNISEKLYHLEIHKIIQMLLSEFLSNPKFDKAERNFKCPYL
jgi:hypothetical protein